MHALSKSKSITIGEENQNVLPVSIGANFKVGVWTAPEPGVLREWICYRMIKYTYPVRDWFKIPWNTTSIDSISINN